jgi:hypothetical protein
MLYVPIRFTLITRAKSSSGAALPSFCTTRFAEPMPAMFMQMRAGPCLSAAFAIAAATLWAFVMSHWQAMPPISPATFCAASALTSSTATFTPSRASSRAVASPSPDAPPVTSAAFPSIFIASPV